MSLAKIALDAKAEDDSAKCMNCKHWKQIPASCCGSCHAETLTTAKMVIHTTDLTVCSKWERADTTETSTAD